ncbi:MAG TPA: DUF3341 domain-containing protein [Bryobacteraceae bacterium]|jgi:hypothetical protein|nr:DUF3341 domain-containing protein [Bryobacteraceae bacterium]
MSEDVLLTPSPDIYGVLAEFDSPEELIRACERAYAEGFRRMDAYSPIPVVGLAEAVGYKKNYVANCVLAAGITGVLFGFGLLEWIANVAYPHNVGGRPTNSWPTWIPITFECMILFSALTALFSMLVMNKLPQPYHPLFNVPEFDRSSIDKFFICIESSDPKFRTAEVSQFLRGIGGNEVTIVPV